MKTIKYKKREKEVLDKIVLLLKEKLNPGLIILFGSRASGKHNTGSDFDIALDGDKIDVREMRKLKEKLEEISGLYRVDLIFLESVDSEFKNIIIRRGKILYGRCA
ncbi:MAG: nucleotidyltransferase domain-containing protein [Actinomycetia bacterium]|nr:nucleotidyltransferase domain-containing protein [Actinomycetes bacterium]